MPELPREVPAPVPERPNETESGREAEPTPEHQPASATETPAVIEPTPSPVVPATTPVAAPVAKDAVLMKVERVLEDNLSDIYFRLPAPARATFKAEGEKTAFAIRTLIETSKVTARSVLDLIRKWLKLIPHVNRYFLQQESKIKTDRIMALAEKQKNQGAL